MRTFVVTITVPGSREITGTLHASYPGETAPVLWTGADPALLSEHRLDEAAGAIAADDLVARSKMMAFAIGGAFTLLTSGEYEYAD